MKKVLFLLVVTAMSVANLFAQFPDSTANWKSVGAFPDTTGIHAQFFQKSQIHGIEVDPDGKVWIQNYPATDSLTGTGVATIKVGCLRCFNADGTQASFSPIKLISGPGFTDTIGWAGTSYNTGRGLGINKDGNILASFADRLYVIDYKTGLGLAKMIPAAAASLVKCSGDADGNIYTAHVLNGNPIKMYGSDYSFVKDQVTATPAIARAMQVYSNANGNYIFFPGYTGHYVKIWKAGDVFGTCDSVGMVFNLDCESVALQNDGGKKYIWFSAGSTNDLPNRYTADTTPGRYIYRRFTWYKFDPDQLIGQAKTHTPLDSISLTGADGSSDSRPRGIAFSLDGSIVYLGTFSGKIGASPFYIQKQIRSGNSVEKLNNQLVDNYSLLQNYPNPFNPSTSIRFSMPKAGVASLKVFNMLGQEVASLLNERLEAGSYQKNFNASNLASGNYVYQLKANGVTISKKMSFVK